MKAAIERGLGPGVDGCLGKQTTYGRIFFLNRRNLLCVCDVRPWKGIVELKGPSCLGNSPTRRRAHCERRIRKATPSCGARLDRF
jgi:hypothetical protein